MEALYGSQLFLAVIDIHEREYAKKKSATTTFSHSSNILSEYSEGTKLSGDAKELCIGSTNHLHLDIKNHIPFEAFRILEIKRDTSVDSQTLADKKTTSHRNIPSDKEQLRYIYESFMSLM
jgi:hypothetical protein